MTTHSSVDGNLFRENC